MNQQIPAKLRWACRRGMLELDVLLGNFLEKRFLSLSSQEKATFIQLLDSSDQDLFDWLLNKKQPQNPLFSILIEKIRHDAKTSH